MTWTIPATVLPNQLILNTDWNAQVVGNIAELASRNIGNLTYSGANFTTTSPSWGNVNAALSQTVNTESGTRLLCLATFNMQLSGGTLTSEVDFVVDGVRIGNATYGSYYQTNVGYFPAMMIGFATGLSAGSHTVALQWKVDNAATTATMYGSLIHILVLEV